MPKYRDPIHGFIFISEDEQKIVDSIPFQRLRNIRQLATTYLVYHGAEHTRFGHSIGVMHLVTRVFNSVVSDKPAIFSDDQKENEALIIWYRQILRLIALTHDLGHAPFSHATENLFPDNRTHEHYTKKIIEETVIAEYINNIGKKLHIELAGKLQTAPNDLIEKHNIRPITPQLLWMIYGEKPHISNKEYIWPDFVFLKSFMDSELDCDKMDYLLRDSLFCGVTYGKYDLDRFISTLMIHKNKSENSMMLAINSGGIQAFEEFVLARYFMFIQVYFHKTRRHLDRLLIKGLQEVLPNGKFPKNTDNYLEWDDTRVIYEMRQANKPYSQKYLKREVMACIFETQAHAKQGEKALAKSLLDGLRRDFPAASFQFDEVDKKAHKLLPPTYSPEDDSGGLIVVDKHTGEQKNIMDCSLILRGISEKIYICRIYASGDSIEGICNGLSAKYSEYSK
jgi:HD superfamily phosphohydrolase